MDEHRRLVAGQRGRVVEGAGVLVGPPLQLVEVLIPDVGDPVGEAPPHVLELREVATGAPAQIEVEAQVERAVDREPQAEGEAVREGVAHEAGLHAHRLDQPRLDPIVQSRPDAEAHVDHQRQ